MSSALSKIIGTAKGVSSIPAAVSGAAYAATGGRVGSDPTPGYSVSNVVRTQLGNLTNGANPVGAKKGVSGGMPASYPGGSGYQYGSYDPSSAAAAAQQNALVAQLRGQAVDKIRTIQSAYRNLEGAVNQEVADKSNKIHQNYGNQTTQLNNQFADTANGIAGNYGNRGIGDSSYEGNAQDSAKNTYNTNLNQINQSQANDLESLGKYANQALTQYHNAEYSYNPVYDNLGNYGAADLQTLVNNLGSDYNNVSNTAAGTGTQAQFVNQVNAIAPQQNGGASALQSQLQSVLNSSAPGFAKQAIGQGLITQATQGDPAAQDAANKYFQQLQTTASTGG